MILVYSTLTKFSDSKPEIRIVPILVLAYLAGKSFKKLKILHEEMVEF